MPSGVVLTIITPVYNGEKYISETIQSVISANITINYEHIVVNDGSTDSTISILNQYREKIVIISQHNSGESAAVNAGLRLSKGKFVLVINADDPLLSGELINRGVKILVTNPSIVAVYPDWKIISDSNETKKIKILPEYSDDLMIGRCRCLPGPGTIFCKDAAVRIGGRRTNWKFVSDYDFWLRMSRQGIISRLPGVLAQWRESHNSTSVSQRGLSMANERIKVIESFLLENKLPLSLQRKARGNSYYLAARLTFFDSSIPGRAMLFKAFINRRGWPEEARLHVVVFLILMPFSAFLVKIYSKLAQRLTID
jgi:glycosyltransferase involved in cell wall biosynthesis